MLPSLRVMIVAFILMALLAACNAKGSEETSISLATRSQPATIASLEATISAIVEPSTPATVEPIETVASVMPQPADTSTTESESTGTMIPEPGVTLVMASPSTAPSPEVSETPTSEAQPAPTVELEEGYVNYTFTDSESGESMNMVLPEYVASAVSLAEIEPGRTHKGAPLAYARIEGELGSRVFRVGNINIATEEPSGFTVNSELTNESGYLGFEAGIGYTESLGGVDPDTVQGNTNIYAGASLDKPGIGTLMRTFYERLTPVSATRTHLLVTHEGKLIETARIKIAMGYRDGGGNYQQIYMTSHYMVYVDDEKRLIKDWVPPFGQQQERTIVFWFSSNTQGLDERRKVLIDEGDTPNAAGNTNFELLLEGDAEMIASSGVSSLSDIDLPIGIFAAFGNGN